MVIIVCKFRFAGTFSYFVDVVVLVLVIVPDVVGFVVILRDSRFQCLVNSRDLVSSQQNNLS